MKMAVEVFIIIQILFLTFLSCNSVEKFKKMQVLVEAEVFMNGSTEAEITELERGNKAVRTTTADGWLTYDVDVPVAGRYQCEIRAKALNTGDAEIWIEDYYDNSDNRTYNITGSMKVNSSDQYQQIVKDGSPLNKGLHKMKLHYAQNIIEIDYIKFTLLKKHQVTPVILTQKMDGKNWELVWADEFDGQGLPDTNKWTFDIGNWGWGNNEPQYYTEFRTENARQENGHLIIEAHKNDMGNLWTSARLTTRGKVSFVYGKIEFRAMPPAGVGTWAALWLLGDSYVDEISWPYCGEIDVLEYIGREVDQETGDGINHASCHSRAYYFKQGNQLTNTIPVKNMTSDFHIYTIEWTPRGIDAFVDDVKYYTYDKLSDELEWPFNNPQNIIVNLAMGGGMGGDIAENITSQKLILDYIRVYQKY